MDRNAHISPTSDGRPIRGIASLGGVACVNTTAILYEGDPAPLAQAISEQLARMEPLLSPPNRDSWLAPEMISPEAAVHYLGERVGHGLRICDDGQDADYRLIEEGTERSWWVRRS